MTNETCKRVELGTLIPPWPAWVSIDTLDDSASVVITAKQILSDIPGDGAERQDILRMIMEMAHPDAVVHAWLLEDRDYIEYVNGEFGGDTTIHLQVLDDRASGATSYTGSTRGVSAEMMVLSCTLTGLMTIGLPARFLNSFDDKDRIGLVPSSSANVDLLHCPTYNEMLHTYRLVVLTGGEHNSDCIFASRQMDRGELLGTVRRAAAQAKIETSYLGLIEGTRYDELYERTI